MPPEVDLGRSVPDAHQSWLDYNSYVGIIGIGRIQRGKIKTNHERSVVIDREGKRKQGRVLQVLGFMGLERHEVAEAEAGDIVAISGIEGLGISDTVCSPDGAEALPGRSPSTNRRSA